VPARITAAYLAFRPLETRAFQVFQSAVSGRAFDAARSG
jgi:hypothetical protein